MEGYSNSLQKSQLHKYNIDSMFMDLQNILPGLCVSYHGHHKVSSGLIFIAGRGQLYSNIQIQEQIARFHEADAWNPILERNSR